MDDAVPQVAGAPKANTAPSQQPSNLTAKIWLLGCAGILVLAVLLRTENDRQVLLPWTGIALPETCGMRWQLGIDCPGCGLTRSFIHIAHGNWSAAWTRQPLGFLVFAYVALQIPLALAHVLRIDSPGIRRLTRGNSWALIGLVSILFLRWFVVLSLGGLWG